MAIELKFTVERPTKNTVRYQEVTDGGDVVIGTLYIQKSALAKLGNPGALKVTIEAVEGSAQIGV